MKTITVIEDLKRRIEEFINFNPAGQVRFYIDSPLTEEITENLIKSYEANNKFFGVTARVLNETSMRAVILSRLGE